MVKKILAYLLVISVFFFLGFFASRINNRKVEPGVVEIRDTIYYYDTTVIEKPVPKYVYVTRRDTLRTEYWHLQHDTVEVEVPIETKVYEEDSVYRAVVSGWHANLDSLWIYHKETEITITKKIPAPKWSFGITAGPSALITPNGSIKGGLGITAGIQYRF